MKVLLSSLICVVFPNLLEACGPVLYSNVGHNVPFFPEKGEFSGEASYVATDGGESARGIGIQVAYSVSDKVGAISSFHSLKGDDSGDNEWEGKGSYFEIGGRPL